MNAMNCRVEVYRSTNIMMIPIVFGSESFIAKIETMTTTHEPNEDQNKSKSRDSTNGDRKLRAVWMRIRKKNAESLTSYNARNNLMPKQAKARLTDCG